MHIKTGQNSYYVYIIANKERTRLEAGSTGDLESLILQMNYETSTLNRIKQTYLCHVLLHWENFEDARKAIARRNEIQKWPKSKQEALVSEYNPEWKSMNEEILRNNGTVFKQVR